MWTPLTLLEARLQVYLASAEGHAATIKLLLRSGARIEAREGAGLSPLCWAFQEGHETAVRVLLEAGADLSATTFEGRIALSQASQRSSEGTMQLLLDNIAEIDSNDGSGWTTLQMASRMGRVSITCFLLEAGVNQDTRGKRCSDPPLFFAAMSPLQVFPTITG